MIYTILLVLFILWVFGFAVHLGGDLIHLLLVIIVIGVIYKLVIDRRSV